MIPSAANGKLKQEDNAGVSPALCALSLINIAYDPNKCMVG